MYNIQTPENQTQRKSWKKSEQEENLTNRGIVTRITVDFLSETMQAGRNCKKKKYTNYQEKKKSVIYNSIAKKFSFKREGEVKIFLDKNWGTYFKQTCLTRNIKRSYLGIRKIILVRNLDLYKGKSTGEGINEDKIKSYLFLFLIDLNGSQ